MACGRGAACKEREGVGGGAHREWCSVGERGDECCFVLLIPTPEEYRVPRVNPVTVPALDLRRGYATSCPPRQVNDSNKGSNGAAG